MNGASVLVKGVLFRSPESRVSKSGNAYTMATLKERVGTEFRFWRLFAFSDTARAELERLEDGDALAVQGAFSLEEFEGRDGARKQTLKVVVEHVIALRQPPKKRTPSASAVRDTIGRSWQAPFDDDLPFGFPEAR